MDIQGREPLRKVRAGGKGLENLEPALAGGIGDSTNVTHSLRATHCAKGGAPAVSAVAMTGTNSSARGDSERLLLAQGP